MSFREKEIQQKKDFYYQQLARPRDKHQTKTAAAKNFAHLATRQSSTPLLSNLVATNKGITQVTKTYFPPRELKSAIGISTVAASGSGVGISP